MAQLDTGPRSEGEDHILEDALENAEAGAEQKEALEKTKELAKQLKSICDEFVSYGLHVKFVEPTSDQLKEGFFGRLHVFVGETEDTSARFHTYDPVPQKPGEVQVLASGGVTWYFQGEVISHNFKEAKLLTMQTAAQNNCLGIAETKFTGSSNMLKEEHKDRLN